MLSVSVESFDDYGGHLVGRKYFKINMEYNGYSKDYIERFCREIGNAIKDGPGISSMAYDITIVNDDTFYDTSPYYRGNVSISCNNEKFAHDIYGELIELSNKINCTSSELYANR